MSQVNINNPGGWASGSFGNSITLSAGTGSEGDVLVAFLQHSVLSIEELSGWTRHGIWSSGGGTNLSIYTHVVSETDPEEYDFYYSDLETGYLAGHILRTSNVNASNPVQAVTGSIDPYQHPTNPWPFTPELPQLPGVQQRYIYFLAIRGTNSEGESEGGFTGPTGSFGHVFDRVYSDGSDCHLLVVGASSADTFLGNGSPVQYYSAVSGDLLTGVLSLRYEDPENPDPEPCPGAKEVTLKLTFSDVCDVQVVPE